MTLGIQNKGVCRGATDRLELGVMHGVDEWVDGGVGVWDTLEEQER